MASPPLPHYPPLDARHLPPVLPEWGADSESQRRPRANNRRDPLPPADGTAGRPGAYCPPENRAHRLGLCPRAPVVCGRIQHPGPPTAKQTVAESGVGDGADLRLRFFRRMA